MTQDNDTDHFEMAKEHVEQAQQEAWGDGDPINDINQALAHLRSYEHKDDTGGMFHGDREELACGCGNSEELKIAVNADTREVIVGCPECREDILKGTIRWRSRS